MSETKRLLGKRNMRRLESLRSQVRSAAILVQAAQEGKPLYGTIVSNLEACRSHLTWAQEYLEQILANPTEGLKQ